MPTSSETLRCQFSDASQHLERCTLQLRTYEGAVEPAIAAFRKPGREGVSRRSLEKCANHLNNSVFGIKEWERPPFVEGQAGMRNVKADHVAYPYVVGLCNLHKGMLIHHPGQGPVAWRGFGRCISGSIVQGR